MEKVGLEFIHSNLYGVAIKMARKFVSKSSDQRPILKYALLSKNGGIYATDLHRFIHIKDVHGFKKNYLVEPKSFMLAKGEYPDVERLLDKKSHQKTIILTKEQIKLWLQVLKSLNQTIKLMKVSDRNNTVSLNFGNNEIDLEVKSLGIKMLVPYEEYNMPNFSKIHFSGEYMRDALETHFKLNSEKLTFYFHGPVRPIHLDNGLNVNTMILPIRTY